MSSIVNQQLRDHWRQTLNSTNQDLCVFAPRQSGKTTALRRLYLATPNSLIVCVNQHMVEDTKQWVSENQFTFDDYSIISEGSIGGQGSIGRRYTTIILDEVSLYRSNIPELLATILPACNRVVAATTPNGDENTMMLRRYFRNVNLEYTYDDGLGLVPKKVVKEFVEHFDKQGDLFKI